MYAIAQDLSEETSSRVDKKGCSHDMSGLTGCIGSLCRHGLAGLDPYSRSVDVTRSGVLLSASSDEEVRPSSLPIMPRTVISAHPLLTLSACLSMKSEWRVMCFSVNRVNRLNC